MLHIKHNIKLIRSLTGLKQEAFIGFFPGVSVAMQKSYETGKAKPDTGYVDRLARIAGVTIEDVQNKQLAGAEIKLRVEKEEKNFEILYYEALERERKALEEDKAFFKEMLRTSLGSILTTTQEMWARQKGTGEVVLESLERLEKKPEGELVDKADRRTFEIDKEVHKPGSAPVRDR